jgi:hypothetical protein
MTTHIIILAQGRQTRLPALPVAKQLLPLPACNGTPILYRTMRQIWHLLPGVKTLDDRVIAVSWLPVMERLQREAVVIGGDERYYPNVDTLSDPGNSSLKGIARYLEKLTREADVCQKRFGATLTFERTVVLLGDVVYSWACLQAILFKKTPLTFCGTSDISPSGGELWGIAWSNGQQAVMTAALEVALAKHPPFAEYQPGQLRRWMWAIHPEFQTTARYAAIDDYTRDIDLPEHVEQLPRLSELAAADDAANGVTW